MQEHGWGKSKEETNLGLAIAVSAGNTQPCEKIKLCHCNWGFAKGLGETGN